MPYSSPLFKQLFSAKHAYIAIILTVSFGAYLNTLSNNFVYDDEFQIVENAWIKDVRFIPQIFLSDIWGFMGEGGSHYYRPLIHIVYMIDYHIFGLNPWGFHLTYIIFHAGASVLVFLIAFALFNINNLKSHEINKLSTSYNLMPAFVAGLLFATHPINTEAVVLGGNEPLFAFFYLLSFYLYINADGTWSKGFILSLAFFFVSTLCKETALTLPLLLFAYDYSFKKEPALCLSPKTFYILVRKYIPYLVAAGIYFIMRSYAIGGIAPLKRHPELSNYQYIINVFPLFVQYLEKLILPINLNYFYVFRPILSIFEWKAIIASGLILVFICLIYLFRKKGDVFFSLWWIVIPLLPVFYIPALGQNIFAERYLYLSSVGFALLMSLGMERIYHIKIAKRASLVMITFVLTLIVGFYSTQTIKRTYIWKDNYTLWLDTVEKTQDWYLPHNNLGLAYYNRGLIDKAIEHYQIAVRLNPYAPEIYTNLGNAYFDKGWLDKAIEYYQIAIGLKPNYQNYNQLAGVYRIKGLIDKAIEYYKITSKLKPDLPEAYNNIGAAYGMKGQTDLAIEYLKIALKLKPNYPDANNNIGLVYYNTGLIDKAIEYYQIAVRLKPDYEEAHYNLGLAYLKKGMKFNAREEFESASKLKSGLLSPNQVFGTFDKRP